MRFGKDSTLRLAFSLGLVTILAGALLGGVYQLTKGPIDQAKIQAQEEAIKNVLPAFDTLAEPVDVTTADGRVLRLYPAFADGQFVGAAVESGSSNGFSGNISVMFGFDTSGRVAGYRVLSHAETPGLGAKMEEWFRDSGVGRRSVVGLDPAVSDLRVSKDGGEVDGITAATITSRAHLESLRAAYQVFVDYKKDNQQ